MALTKDDLTYVQSMMHLTQGNKHLVFTDIHPDNRPVVERLLNELGPYCEKVKQAIEMLEANAQKEDWSDSDPQKEFQFILDIIKLEE